MEGDFYKFYWLFSSLRKQKVKSSKLYRKMDSMRVPNGGPLNNNCPVETLTRVELG